MEEDEIYAACPLCLSFVEKKTEKDAKGTANKHNNSAHGGDEVAMVLKTNYDSFADFVENAKENSNENQYMQLINKMRKGNLEIFLSAKDYEEIMDRVEE